MACGAQAHLAISAVTGLAPTTEVWLFGSEGTLHYTPEACRADGVVTNSGRTPGAA